MLHTKYVILIAILFLSAKGFGSIVIDTTTIHYNFNNLTAGNLNGQDAWVTTKHATTGDYQVSASAGYDTSNALTFSQSGPSVGIDASRSFASLFNSTAFSNTASKYIITFDVYRSYWGVQFALATDINNDGKITNSDVAEKALVFSTSTQAGDKLTLPNGSITTYTASPTIAWTTIEITLSNFSTSSGTISVRTKVLGTTTWNTLANNLALGIDTNSTTKTNPSLWKMLFLHNEGAGGKLDNFSFTRIGPHIVTSRPEVFKNNQVAVFPNPAENKVTLELPEVSANALFKLFTVSGIEILEEKIYTKQQTISLEGLEPGVYFYQIKDYENPISVGKLIIN